MSHTISQTVPHYVPDVPVMSQCPTVPTLPTPAPAPIIIQLPNQFYQNSTNAHLELSSSTSKLPSIGKFFSHLDQKYNNNNVYTKFEEAFLEEEITVNAIKDLTDDQLQKLGVIKIGWQKNIKQAAQKY